MKNVIMGTAGHVDHGKTSLIKALTGIDTDRLKDEKKRGITIELGFAHLDFEGGRKIGIIDVPGHERFVKNMLAGSGGIDIALLVVAANEGVMPQTKEHMEILKLLGIKSGIITITKIDMADRDWIEMVKEDIKELVKGSFLEDAPIYETSVYNNEGLEELKKGIFELSEKAIEKDLNKGFRLPVDRVFSIDGFGTVVTGTLIEGMINKGDSAVIYTPELETKVRNIQVHDMNVDTAYTGQRVAINLSSVKKEEIQRGFVIAKPGSLENTYMVDVKLNLLADTERTIKNNSRVHFYHGSSEVLAKVILLDKEEIKKGEQAYAQLRLEEEIALKYADRYIVRFYSPMETIGGGFVLNPNPKKHSRNKKEIIQSLEILEKGDSEKRTEEFIKERSKEYPKLSEIKGKANLSDEEFSNAVSALINKKLIVELPEETVISKDHYDFIWKKAIAALKEFHSGNMYKKGMNLEEFKSRVFRGTPDLSANAIISALTENKKIILADGLVSDASFKVQFDPLHSKLADEIEKAYMDAGVLVPNKDDILNPIKDRNKIKIFEALVEAGTLVMIDKQMFFHKDVYENCLKIMKEHIEKNGTITLGEFRDLIGASRKYAVALLEYWDSKKITKKVGDARVLTKK
ncbi:selenocysteine-specific translation elongation factor [Anaeropeptidivorans aminofermentans]|uniref:selenocysteine-specific translation elongation factor n=1 Tax=Anaeropeptidivorans aminofermentans TaxID=2934315 RepID=UPI0020252CF2|nr:selenocysteine-specific translation elongation factor [Anaeropeptidivorans aminofermentans]